MGCNLRLDARESWPKSDGLVGRSPPRSPRRPVPACMGPLAFDNDEIKILLEAGDRDDRVYQDLDLEAGFMPHGVSFDLIPINKPADFAPGQVFVHLQGLHGRYWRADVMTVSTERTFVVFPDRRFVHGAYCDYSGMRLGDAGRFRRVRCACAGGERERCLDRRHRRLCDALPAPAGTPRQNAHAVTSSRKGKALG